MDPKLLKATLYSGSQIPGGGPFTHTAPISATAANSLDAAFNAGFLVPDSNGGYYTDNKTVIPLRTGAASFVVYKDGTSTVGQWGRDVAMGPNVAAVRQNLDLLVDNGAVVPAAYSANSPQWGKTVGGKIFVWRSGLGVTANGALVYVGGPGLDIADLANILVQGGRRPGHGAGHQYGLGELQHVRAVDAGRGGDARQRQRAALRHDRHAGSLLPDVVGTGLHHHVGRCSMTPVGRVPDGEPSAGEIVGARA